MSAYSEDQILDLIRRAYPYLSDDYVRENLAIMRSAKKRYDSRKSHVHQQADWNDVEEHAWRLNERLNVLSAGLPRPES
jgi:hypothetical protein